MNVKFIIEGMEEAGSPALEELVRREKGRFFSSVDYIVISDNLWISQRKPALIYGTRGNSYFTVEVPANLGACREEASRGPSGRGKALRRARVRHGCWMHGPGAGRALGPGVGAHAATRTVSGCASRLFLGGGSERL